jgi:hypothetical protein
MITRQPYKLQFEVEASDNNIVNKYNLTVHSSGEDFKESGLSYGELFYAVDKMVKNMLVAVQAMEERI